MMDTDAMYDQFLQEFEAFLRARSRRRRLVLNPFISLERLINRGLQALERAVGRLALAVGRQVLAIIR
jgi:hypothetical protein